MSPAITGPDGFRTPRRAWPDPPEASWEALYNHLSGDLRFTAWLCAEEVSQVEVALAL